MCDFTYMRYLELSKTWSQKVEQWLLVSKRVDKGVIASVQDEK